MTVSGHKARPRALARQTRDDQRRSAAADLRRDREPGNTGPRSDGGRIAHTAASVTVAAKMSVASG